MGNDNVIDLYSGLPLSQLTPRQVFREISEIILEEWYYHEDNSTLNSFITNSIPPKYAIPGEDFVNDLNVINYMEYKLGMVISVHAQGATEDNLDSLMITFLDEGETYMTNIIGLESFHPEESYCRALNIVLFVAFQLAKKQYNLNSTLDFGVLA